MRSYLYLVGIFAVVVAWLGGVMLLVGLTANVASWFAIGLVMWLTFGAAAMFGLVSKLMDPFV